MKVKFLLKDSEIPKTWYNIMADMPNPPAAVLHPGTGKPVSPDDLAPLHAEGDPVDRDLRAEALGQALHGQDRLVVARHGVAPGHCRRVCPGSPFGTQAAAPSRCSAIARRQASRVPSVTRIGRP